jgi:hypothetical protein
MRMVEDEINLAIGRSEALVLFEMLADFTSQPVLEIGGPAERLALVRFQGALEKTLVEPFMPNYQALIDEARVRLIAQAGTS